MIAVKVRNKDVLNAGKFYTELTELNLCSFPTINQNHLPFYFKELSGSLCIFSRSGCIATQNR